MKIGSIEAPRGEKAFGFFTPLHTHGCFDVHIPIHIVNGASDGPVLLVQAGVSGVEIEPSMILPHVIEQIDPENLSGTLLLVPLLNTTGFEFEQKNAVWDNKDLNALGRGNRDGSVSERLVCQYFKEVISRADALIDIHTGALWGYFRYAGVYDVGSVTPSLNLARALGLPQVLLGQQPDQSMAFEACKDGKTVVSAWIGGGPGLRDHGSDDRRRITNAVFSAMEALGMLKSDVQNQDELTEIVKAHTFLTLSHSQGLVLLDKEKRGRHVEAGERLGVVRHPFTGVILEELTAPRPGVMLHAGAAWPILRDQEGTLIAILGDHLDESALTS